MARLLEKYRDYQLMIVGLALMVGIIAASAITAVGLVEFRKAGTQAVTVTGAASEDITSDFVKWQPAVVVRGDTMQQAYEGLRRDTEIVAGWLRSKGLKPEEIRVQPTQVETVYGRTPNGGMTNQIEGYILRLYFSIESGNVTGIEKIANEAMELVNRGVTLEVNQPQYFYTKLDDMKVKMLGLATENAKQRAQAMAKSTGNRIGHMRSSQMGVFQITPRHSTDVSDYGINDTSTIDKKMTAVVNVTFALD